MHGRIKVIYFLACLVALSQPAAASHCDETCIKNFAYSDAWLNLAYYKPQAFNAATYISRITTQQSFIAPDGRSNPFSELTATIAALQADNASTTAKDAASCRFPARRRLLERALQLSFPVYHCDELDNWMRRLNPERVSLVFSSAFANNPASMFGHTFLKVGPAPHNGAPREAADLLSYGISFAAETGDADSLTYISYGLTGGFPAYFSVAPFYMKLKEYAQVENRDLWDYELAFDKDERQFLGLLLWELTQGASFDYYFLSANCSYALLALLDAVRPSLALQKKLPAIVTPVETVKALTSLKGFANKPYFIPSERRKLIAAWAAVGQNADPVRRIIAEQNFGGTTLSAKQLDALLSYLTFVKFEKEGRLDAETAALLDEALSRRAALPKTENVDDLTPEHDEPEKTHAMSLLSIGSGFDDKAAAYSLGFRPGYHSLLDTGDGYPRDLSIHVLDTNITLGSDASITKARLVALDLLSIEPWQWFDPKPAWGVRAACDAQWHERWHQCGVEVGVGLSAGVRERVRFALLPLLRVSGVTDQSTFVNAGVGYEGLLSLRLGRRLASTASYKSQTDLSFRSRLRHDTQSMTIALSLSPARAWQIVLNLEQINAKHPYENRRYGRAGELRLGRFF